MKYHKLIKHERPVSYVLFNHDGDLLFSAGKEGMIHIWQPFEPRHLGTISCGAAVNGLDVNYESTHVMAALGSGSVVMFDVATGEMIHAKHGERPFRSIEYNRKPGYQNMAISCHQAGPIQCWQIRPDGIENYWSNKNVGVCSTARWGAFDSTVVCAGENGRIVILDAETGELMQDLEAHAKRITQLTFNDDRTLMLSTCKDGTAALWDCSDWSVLTRFTTDRPLNAGVISPLYNKGAGPENKERYHVLLAGGIEARETAHATARAWEVLIHHMIRGSELGRIDAGHFGPINSLAIHPSGVVWASGGEDSVLVWGKLDGQYFTDYFA